MAYKRPKTLYEWKIDEPDEELYLVSILDDETVVSAYGRCAHGSGCKIVSWQQFLAGEMNSLVEKTMGKRVLGELQVQLQELSQQ